MTPVVEYDEFGLFASNAEELGIPYVEPAVARTHVEVGDGRQISALRWGAGSVELVLIHGGAQNAHTWDSVGLLLDRPFLALDLPGHGHSSHRDDHAYWPTENAIAVEQALRALDIAPRLVVGMSLGGLTSVALAARCPDLVPALTLVDVTPGVDGEKASAIVQFVNGPETFATFDEILERTILFNPTRSHESLRRGVLHNAHQLADGSWSWRYDLPRTGSGEGETGRVLPGLAELWDAIGAYRGQLTLVRGSTSPVVSDADVAELRRRNPAAEVIVVDGAGHSVQGDKPHELAAIITSRLSP
jgi:pimeloyl-ACP methyl ester carboxylesterase